MTAAGMEAFHVLLEGMRTEFLLELPERCDHLEAQILTLEKSPDDRESFNALYRGVHSLKGSGGTHGLTIVTTLCHQLENLLGEADARQPFDAVLATRALAHVDLLRQVESAAQSEFPDYSAIETGLEALRRAALQRRKAVLIAESSVALASLYGQTLANQAMQATLVDDGLAALERLLHEPFDLVVVGRELKTLDGVALLVALRASQSRNRGIPALLLTSRGDAIPEYAGVNAVIARGPDQADKLLAAVKAALEG